VSSSLHATVGGPTDPESSSKGGRIFDFHNFHSHLVLHLHYFISELGAVIANLFIHCAHQ
jgi:hypothetical protein